MTFLQLLKLVMLKNIRAERFLAMLSIIGVALGIGLFSGVKAASDKAALSFESDISGINPYANYEVFDTSGLDFNEVTYATVRGINDDSFPVIDVKGYLPETRETVDIRGIDTIRIARFLKLAARGKADFGRYFTDTSGVVVTRQFADRHALGKGGRLRTLVYDREFMLTVVDIADMPLLPVNTLFMDLGNFQDYFGKAGYLSKIDVAADDSAAAEIRKRLPSSLAIENKEQVIKAQKSLIRSFRYNLQFVSLISILVGIFLLYNTIFISVVKRRTEIGILRALGIGQKTVVLLFIIQGLFLGLIGSTLGIICGQVVAWFSVAAVAKTISTMYATIAISDYSLSRGDILLSLGLGLLVSFLASAVPALEAAGTRPNESVREGTFEGRYRGSTSHYPGYYKGTGLFLVISGCVLSYIDYRGMPFEFPFLAYAGILAIILGFTVLSPLYLSFLLRLLKRPLEKLFGPAGIITAGDMEGSTVRLSVALMSVAISSALIISLFILIFSFRSSLKSWIDKNISADVYVKPASCTSNFCYFPLSDDLVKTVETAHGISFIDRFRTLQIDFRGRKIVAGFGDRAALQKHFPRKTDGSRVPGSDREIGVSSYLAVKYGLKLGEQMAIGTPAGTVKFTIGDIFSSYSTASGFVYLDRKWLLEYWGIDDATQLGIYLGKDTNSGTFIKGLRQELLPHYAVEIMDNSELRKQVLSIFDQTFAITYAIELITILVSLIGVVNILMALVLERKREISIIRYLGAGWGQLRGMLVLTAGILGIAGILLGAAIGLAMSIIFIQVINRISFGWEIQFRLPIFYLSLTAAGLFLTTLVAGLIPVQIARKIDPKKFISFE